MNNLLDTHVIIWFINGEDKISNSARNAIESKTSINYVSIASLWEMAIKISIGKLELKTSFSEIINQFSINNFQLLPISAEDTLLISKLPFHHRDPFDRLMVAQCINNNLTLISKDSFLKEYSINLIC